MTERETGQHCQASAQPQPDFTSLALFVGAWHSEWQVYTDRQHLSFYGTDTYEWMSDGVSMAHHTYVRRDDRDYHVMQIIGHYDTASQTYPTHSCDTRGKEITMRARVGDNGMWIFEGDTHRARLEVNKDGNSMQFYWEQLRDDSHWRPWMKMDLTRQ